MRRCGGPVHLAELSGGVHIDVRNWFAGRPLDGPGGLVDVLRARGDSQQD